MPFSSKFNSPPVAVVIPPVAAVAQAPVQKVAIEVTKEGFVPATVEAKADVPIELVFTRRTDDTCAKEVEVPSMKVRKALPLNQPVSIIVPAGPVLDFDQPAERA